jgi:hypothetical protein
VIPVDQTIFGAPAGNCLAACVASLLHLDIADVPNVCEDGAGWVERLADWLQPRGLVPLAFGGPPPSGFADALCIVSGQSPRGPWLHATVWRGDKMVHDPHPDRTGILDVSDTLLLVPLDPVQALRP